MLPPVAVVVAWSGQEDELLGVLHGEQPKEHLVDEREDRRVHADAEGDRGQRDEREDGGAGQSAPGVAQVLRDMHAVS
jgi:hypothetical protein